MSKIVDVLIEKAKTAKSADEALKYSQAALNAENALAKRREIEVFVRTHEEHVDSWPKV